MQRVFSTYIHVIYRRHHERSMPLSSSPQCTINTGDWQLSCSSMFPRRPQLSAASCLLLWGICTHSVPERLGIPLQINGKKRLEEKSRGDGRNPRCRRWKKNGTGARLSSGGVQEKQERLLQVSSAASLTAFPLYIVLRIFIFLFFARAHKESAKRRQHCLQCP